MRDTIPLAGAAAPGSASDASAPVRLVETAIAAMSHPWVGAVLGLLARVLPAIVFFRSGLTRVDGFGISETTYFLFAEEFKAPLLPPNVAAVMTTIAEITLPPLLVLGLASRFAALGMFVMTLVIQLFVYPDAFMTAHGWWMVALLVVIHRGPGLLSLDHLIARRLGRQARA